MPRMSEISPDGSRLLEVRFTNGTSDIYVSDADGSHAQRIVRGVSAENEAHWSRDGTRILYAASGSGAAIPAAGGRPEELGVGTSDDWR